MWNASVLGTEKMLSGESSCCRRMRTQAHRTHITLWMLWEGETDGSFKVPASYRTLSDLQVPGRELIGGKKALEDQQLRFTFSFDMNVHACTHAPHTKTPRTNYPSK